MYTILLTKDKTLIATQKEAIMQYSNLVDKIQFLVPPMISENDMTTFTTVLLEYISPISKIYRTEMLTVSPEMYKEHLQYLLPVDTKITAENGDIEVHLTFYKTEMTADGEAQVPIFKTQTCKITVIPISNWSQFVPDNMLQPLDQRIAEMLVLQKEITAIQEQIMNYQQNGDLLIDDENISDKTTYSSKKIEEKFYDETEVKTEVSDTVEEKVDQKFDEFGENQSVSNEEIDSIFNKETSPDNPSESEEPENEISTDDIDSLF